MSDVMRAEEYRIEYIRRKEEVLKLLQRAIEYYEGSEKNDATDALRTLHKNLMDGEFSIVLVGEFSSGKSTLLNALMGERILPSFTNETTATVNFLRHAEKSTHGEKGCVYYYNGSTKELDSADLDTVMKYASTKGDDVAQSVAHLDLYLDSKFLKDGVTLVDSPGLNGVAEGHKEITEQQILKSHASIFVFSSDHPGTKTDFEFLHDLQRKVKTIIFVLNKIDDIKKDENESPESVIETLKQNYKNQFSDRNTVPEIWPVSAYAALTARSSQNLSYHDRKDYTEQERKGLEEGSKLVLFEDRLLKFLTCGEKAQQQLLSPVERVIVLASDTISELNQNKSLLEGTADSAEIEEQIIKVKEVVSQLEDSVKGSCNEVQKSLKLGLNEVVEGLSAQINGLSERKLREIDSFDDLDDLNDYIQVFEKNFLQRVYSYANESEERLRQNLMEIVQMQYFSQADLIKERLLESGGQTIKLEVMNHLDTSERNLEAGIKEMDEKTAALKKELAALEEEEQRTEEDYLKHRNLTKRREGLENEIRNLQDSKDTIENKMLPPKQQYTQEVHTKERRGGIIGTIGWVLFGGKNVTHHETKTDSTEHDEALRHKENQIMEKSQEIEQKKIELEKMIEADPELQELRHMKAMTATEKARMEYSDTLSENKQLMIKKYQREIHKCKKVLEDFCDEITDDLLKQVKKELGNAEKLYTNAIMEVVEVNLKRNIEEQQGRLERLQAQMEASESEKKAKIEEINMKMEDLRDILSNAIDLQAELEKIDVDTISQIEI
jgi:small GTP-binding protein